MNRNKSLLALMLSLLVASGCAQESVPTPTRGTAPADLKGEASALYERYGSALAKGDREAIPGFYHPDGALVVFNGESWRSSHAELRQRYLTQWSPPHYFTWDSLAFDPISDTQVIVTGGFRWQTTASADTGRYIYAAVLSTTDSSLAIVFEHETNRPPR